MIDDELYSIIVDNDITSAKDLVKELMGHLTVFYSLYTAEGDYSKAGAMVIYQWLDRHREASIGLKVNGDDVKTTLVDRDDFWPWVEKNLRALVKQEHDKNKRAGDITAHRMACGTEYDSHPSAHAWLNLNGNDLFCEPTDAFDALCDRLGIEIEREE